MQLFPEGHKALGTIWFLEVFDNLESDKVLNLQKGVISFIENFEQRYSRFTTDSFLNYLNYDKKVSFDKYLWQMLDLGEKFYKETNGAFDLFIKKYLENKGYGKQIDREEKGIVVDAKKPRVWNDGKYIFLNSANQIDLGGIGKGYLIDILAQKLLQDFEVQFFVINGGGDIYVTSENGNPVTIELEDPFKVDEFVGVVSLKNQSLCASSTHKRKWIFNNQKQNHFIKGDSEKDKASFVIADTAVVADVLATVACIIHDEATVSKIFEKDNAQYWILNDDIMQV
jgi:thiamine biosynthesis lipoprotein